MQFFKKVFILVIVGVSIEYGGSRKLPSYIDLCHQDDPKINECLKKAVEQVRPHLLEGVPVLGIPPLNPLVLPEATLDNNKMFKATFKNIKVYGVSKFVLNKLSADLPKNHLEFDFSFPTLRITSQYNFVGDILVLKLNGSGPADGNFTDIKGAMKVDAVRYVKNGMEYLKPTKKELDLDLGKPVFRFDNLFKKQDITDQTNKIINENIVDVLDELKPILHKTIIEFMFGLVGRLFERFSVDELFPK